LSSTTRRMGFVGYRRLARHSQHCADAPQDSGPSPGKGYVTLCDGN